MITGSIHPLGGTSLKANIYHSLSFYDGLEQDKRIIQILNYYGIKCTFNLNAGLMGIQKRVVRIGNIGFLKYAEGSTGFKTRFKNHDHHRISVDKIAQVYEGFEIASHDYKHEALAMIKPGQMEESIRMDIEGLSKLTGYPIVGHAYPGASQLPQRQSDVILV